VVGTATQPRLAHLDEVLLDEESSLSQIVSLPS
jgi:hypothetical protein